MALIDQDISIDTVMHIIMVIIALGIMAIFAIF